MSGKKYIVILALANNPEVLVLFIYRHALKTPNYISGSHLWSYVSTKQDSVIRYSRNRSIIAEKLIF